VREDVLQAYLLLGRVKRMRRYIKGALVALLMTLVPGTAWAVGVSSDDGSGYQYVTSHGDQSFHSTGGLRSRSGNKVYFRGIVVYNNYPDYTCNRISSDTTSSTTVTRGGSCWQMIPIPPSSDGAGWKICRNRPFFPDGCGSMSREDY